MIVLAALFVADRVVGLVMEHWLCRITTGVLGKDNYICDHCDEEVLVFGSSRTMMHYNAKMMEEELGHTVYNCGGNGYGIILSKLGFNVQKMHYGSQSMLGFTGVDAWKDAEEAEIVVRVRGNTLSIGLPGEEPLFTFTDARPFTHGLCGFFGTGKELTVLSCEITPLE